MPLTLISNVISAAFSRNAATKLRNANFSFEINPTPERKHIELAVGGSAALLGNGSPICGVELAPVSIFDLDEEPL